MTDENTVLKFNSDELKKQLEATSGNYAKFEKGKAYTITVLTPEAEPTTTEYEGKTYQKYNIKIQIKGDDEPKTWSVSRTVLKTIVDSFETTRVFNVMRNDKNYSVIPVEL